MAAALTYLVQYLTGPATAFASSLSHPFLVLCWDLCASSHFNQTLPAPDIFCILLALLRSSPPTTVVGPGI